MKKEIKVYVANVDDLDDDFNVSGHSIKEWNNTDNLPSDALEFIEHCEQNGNVYSLEGFMNSFNLEEISMNSFIFITDKY